MAFRPQASASQHTRTCLQTPSWEAFLLHSHIMSSCTCLLLRIMMESITSCSVVSPPGRFAVIWAKPELHRRRTERCDSSCEPLPPLAWIKHHKRVGCMHEACVRGVCDCMHAYQWLEDGSQPNILGRMRWKMCASETLIITGQHRHMHRVLIYPYSCKRHCFGFALFSFIIDTNLRRYYSWRTHKRTQFWVFADKFSRGI